MLEPTTELGHYINNLRLARNLSLRKASYTCGLSPETIRTIISRGALSTPRPDTLQAIADGLGGNYERLMILAGHWKEPGQTSPSPEVRALLDHLVRVYQDIRHDPAARQAFATSIRVQADALRAVACADEHAEETERQQYQNTKQFA